MEVSLTYPLLSSLLQRDFLEKVNHYHVFACLLKLILIVFVTDGLRSRSIYFQPERSTACVGPVWCLEWVRLDELSDYCGISTIIAQICQ